LDLALFVDHYYKRKPTTNLLATGNLNVPLLDADLQLTNFSITGPMGKRYDNPAFEAKLTESRQSVDPTKRQAALRDAEMLIQEDPPFLFINTLPTVT